MFFTKSVAYLWNDLPAKISRTPRYNRRRVLQVKFVIKFYYNKVVLCYNKVVTTTACPWKSKKKKPTTKPIIFFWAKSGTLCYVTFEWQL